jgi:hypothetical protein
MIINQTDMIYQVADFFNAQVEDSDTNKDSKHQVNKVRKTMKSAAAAEILKRIRERDQVVVYLVKFRMYFICYGCTVGCSLELYVNNRLNEIENLPQ